MVTLKALFRLPLRQATGMMASLLELAGLDWPVPDFSTLSRRQKTLVVEIPCRPSTGALHLLIDSTGIKGPAMERGMPASTAPPSLQWRKVHLALDALMGEIHAIEITGSRVGDAPILPELLDHIPKDQSIAPSALMGPTTQEPATKPLPHVMPGRSNPRAGTRGHGAIAVMNTDCHADSWTPSDTM